MGGTACHDPSTGWTTEDGTRDARTANLTGIARDFGVPSDAGRHPAEAHRFGDT
jgi:hypothetical protein